MTERTALRRRLSEHCPVGIAVVITLGGEPCLRDRLDRIVRFMHDMSIRTASRLLRLTLEEMTHLIRVGVVDTVTTPEQMHRSNAKHAHVLRIPEWVVSELEDSPAYVADALKTMTFRRRRT